MSYDYARFAKLKAEIVASLAKAQHEQPLEICKDGFFLDMHGVWFRKHLSFYNPINMRDDEFGTLIDMHAEDYFCGTNDTYERHAETILVHMQRALEQLRASA